MKKILFLLAMLPMIWSCSNNKYTIVHKIDGKTERIEVDYVSDSDAIINVYCGYIYDMHKRAFLERCINTKDTTSVFDADIVKIIKDGRDIKMDDFEGRDSILQECNKEIVGHLESEYNEMIENMRDRPYIVEKLKPLHKFEFDEFNNITWVRHKDIYKRNNFNGIYCYFGVKDGKPENFRLRIHYYGDHWLFIRKYRFALNGDIYEYTPSEMKRDNNSNVWEWSDEYISLNDRELIEKLSKQDELKIRYIGSTYNDDIKINSKYIKYIKQTFELYEAMGGEFKYMPYRKLHNKAEH